MYGARRAQAGGAIEHIDIRWPAGDDDDDDDNDDNDDSGGDNVPNVNVNVGGIAAHQLQLPPLPANATMEEVLQAYRECQLRNQAQSEELAERRAAQAQSSKASARDADEGGGCGKSRDPPPPPELVSIAKRVGELGCSYAVLVSLWPPVSCWPFITYERPNVDPHDPAQRYPGSGAGGVRVRSGRGQDALADPALRNAVIAELHDFTGDLSVHLTNTWFQKRFARAVNVRKGHMMENLRLKRADIFAGLPDVDPAILNSNNLTRISQDPTIKRYLGASGTSKKWPDLFYRPDKVGNIKYLFRVEWLPRAMKLMCQGRKCLTVGHAPRTNVSAVKWGINEVSYGFIAAGAVGILHLLSGDPSFETTAGPSGLVYPHVFAQIVEHLIKTRNRRQTENLFDWLNRKVFGSMNPETAQPSMGQLAEEEEDDDFEKLDESDSDEELMPRHAPGTHPPSAGSASRSGTRSESESMSSLSQIAPPVPPSTTQPYMHLLPHADIPGRPAAAPTSASVLSYAPIPGAPSSSPSPSQRPMSPPLPPLSYAYQPQPVADHQFEFIPQVAPPTGAPSDTFLAGTASGGYVVALPNHSSNHGISPVPVPRNLHVPVPSVPTAQVSDLRGLHMPVAPVPAAHGSDPRAVPPPNPASVALAVASVNHVALPPPSTSTSHFLQPGASSLAPLVDGTGVDRIEELSEAASHLNVGSGKRKAGRAKSTAIKKTTPAPAPATKKAAPAPATKKAAPAPTPAPAPSRYPTRMRNGQS